MNKIAYPLKPDMQGRMVANLQDALLRCLDRGILPGIANDESTQRKWSAELQSERARRTYGDVTAKIVGCFQEGRRLQGDGEVDEPVASALNTLLREHGLLGTGTGGHVEAHGEKSMKITGTIVDAASQALAGYRVVAYHGDVNLNKEKSVAEARTGKDGAFSLAVNLARYPRGVNVRLAVLDGGAKELWSSPINYNAKVDLEKIDATIPDASLGITDYRRLTDKISPLLQGAKLVELQPAQVGYLAGRSEIGEAQMNLLITAARLHEELSGVPEEACYGLLKQGLPASIAALVALTEKDWKAALDAAARGNVIAPLSGAKEKAIVAALMARKAAEALRPSTPLVAGAASFATVALKTRGKQLKVADLAARQNGVNGAFWKAVEKDRSITASEREKLQNFAAVSEMIGGDSELLRAIAAHLTQRGERVTPAALATIKRTAWSGLVEAAVRANGNRLGAKERKVLADGTANVIAAKVAGAFPTQALWAELSAAPANHYFGRYRNELRRFFDSNSGFDIRTDLYRALNPPDGVNPFRGKDEVKQRLGTMARLFRGLPDHGATTPASLVDGSRRISAFTAISRLAEKEYYSSSKISDTPRARFVADVSAREADKVYWSQVHDRATAMRDIAWLKGAELFQMYRQPFPVMRRYRDAPAEAEAEAGVADWRTLFGSLDMCDCEACASITSPAAYLADILNFLGTEVATAEASPYKVLIDRRPDIEHLLLNCDNANREVPYIDLLNELLEDEVLRQSGTTPVWVPHHKVSLDVARGDLDAAAKAAIAAKKRLVRRLNKELSGYSFDADLEVSVVTQAKTGKARWHLLQHGWLVELLEPAARKKVEVDYISRQTHGIETELAANPAFRNARATRKLDDAKFPLSLPPALPLMETRLFLEHLRVPRERLMKLLAPEEVDRWAIEYLGLSAAEAALITATPPVAPYALWGFDAEDVTEADAWVDPADSTKLLTGPWSEKLRRVDVLIARAGISYIELLDLLDTYFVNPPYASGLRRITIQSTDENDPATCDLSKLKITGKLGWLRDVQKLTHALRTETKIGDPDDLFDRLVRFLRLMRRTGWSSRDLDLAIRQVRPNVLDTKTLGLLATLKWTKDKLRLTHAQACALMGGIDTRRHIDHAADGQPTLPSQYEQLFLNRAITNPVDRNFTLDDTGNELFKTALSLAEGKAAIAAAFEISNAEVSLLGVQQLSLQALSRMYRRVLLARAFKLSVQQIIWLEELNGSLDLSDEIPPFVERVIRLVKSGISANDAWFLLRKTEASTEYLMPRDEEITQTLGSLRDELKKIESEHESPDPVDPDAELLRKRLAELDWGEPLIDELVSVILDTKVFKVHLEPLPEALRKLISPEPNEPTGVELAANASAPKPDNIGDLLVHDRANDRLRALRPLTRADRRLLLCANGGAGSFRKAVEQLYAIGKLSYDEQTDTLSCRGLLPESSRAALSPLPQSAARAIDELVSQQQQLLQQKLRFCSLPTYEVPLDVATSLSFSPLLTPYVYYDSTRKKLVIRGRLTDAEADDLTNNATPKLPQAKVQQLMRVLPTFANFTNLPPPAQPVETNKNELADLLADAAAVKKLFDPEFEATPAARKLPATAAEISARLLANLTPHAKARLSTKAIVSTLGSALGLASNVTQHLIRDEETLRSAVPATPRMVDAFYSLSAGDARAPVDPTLNAGLYEDYRRLSKISLLFQRLKLEFFQLPWVFKYAAAGKWLSAANLTAGDAIGGADLKKLDSLVRLFTVAKRRPYNSQLINEVLRLANDTNSTVDDLLKYVADHWTWLMSDLQTVSKQQGIVAPHPPQSPPLAEQMNAQALEELHEAMTAIGQIGATATQGLDLVKQTLDDDDALLAKSLAKSKHDHARWLEVVRPINDTIREARRSALVDYLVANPRRAVGSGRALWHDAKSLYDYLLVDVQMGACMKTSRIRLALSSVQLFVQRCLMNLESPRVSVSDDPIVRRYWDEWESWRKLYRVWEANRKVFLYPENWIEPELRDDKTPFFKELENELLQGEVTQETAEAAFLNYLHKLDQVAKLEVMGIYIEDETEAPPAQVPSDEGGRATVDAPQRILHVVARTYGDPHQWFYRKLTTTREWHEGIWSPWEKIDADVTGDHILPVVWNHHLYLFWALFEQKADKPTAQERKDNKENPQEPKNRWYIKFAWSEYKNGKWSPKRVSRDALQTPVVEAENRQVSEADFSFKTNAAESGISIKCYGPKVDDPTASAESSENEEEKEGHPFYVPSSHYSAHSAFYFYDERGHPPNPELTLYIYQKGKMLFEAGSNDDGQGSIWLWDRRPDDPNWRKSTVELRTKELLHHINPPNLGTTLHHANFETWAVHAQVVKSLPPLEENQGPTSVRSPGLLSAAPVYAMSGIGRFDFLVCRGDLQPTDPTAENLAEQIPELEADTANQGTRLRAMMYAEHKGTGSFMGGLLRPTRGRYRVLMPHQNPRPDTSQPFFFQDDARAYFVTALPPQWIGTKTGGKLYPRRHRFDVFYHPYVCDFIARVNRKGVKELLTLKSQALDDNGTRFATDYKPESVQVQTSRAREYVDFEGPGSYSIYNWELFFHAPLLIATRLNANQRFSEALRWFHYIFDPTTRPGAFRAGKQLKPTQRFWNVRPFWEAEGRDIHSIDEMLRGAESLSEQYAEWRQSPFKPFVVARLRQVAFMQSVVMRYLDNLIDWGDQQFNLFTMESTNEATLLYTLAAEILGRSPEKIPPRARPTLQTYRSLQEQALAAPAGASSDAWRKFADLMVEIEAYIAPAAVPVGVGTGSSLGRMWAFCVPNNGNLLEYWKRVADRLFKLRHCQDIEGVERKIPLWDPPIDPALLVRAAAAGLDLTSVLGDINAALPSYRFSVMLQKALELCNEVRNFGAALLAVLEKKDGEELAQLRSRHEVDLLQKVKDVKSKQVEESRDLRLAAEKSKLVAEARRDHYRDIPFLISAEQTGLALSAMALTQEAGAVVSDVFAAIAAAFPQFHGGTSGFYSSPVVVSEYGGEQVSRAASATSSVQRSAAALLSSMSALSHTVGGFQRRQHEWKLQETLAQKEIDQIEKQIAAATIREEIANAELVNHDKQTGQAKDVDEFLRSKYTSKELYGWHRGQLSSLYFQAYKLAFDTAKKAERTFRHELGLEESRFVQFGYWDSLKDGLLAGEQLHNDLRRMEVAYLDQNRRELEITKHVSVAALDPNALIVLREVGICEIDIPEWLFDLDYPGHYLRRIKSIALSIPCVAGPYTNVNCTLTQLLSRVRTRAQDYEDQRHLHEYFGSVQSIVTSTAREDSGLFELNFRDERYLPFEGSGVISRWRIKLPREANQFDIGTVSDVILHIRYTARDGGEALREEARNKAKKEVSTGVRIFDVRADFATEWHRFKNSGNGQDSELLLHFGDQHFPFHTPDLSVYITTIGLIVAVDSDEEVKLKVAMGSDTDLNLRPGSGPGNLRSQEWQLSAARKLGDITITGTAKAIGKLKRLLLLCHYELKPIA